MNRDWLYQRRRALVAVLCALLLLGFGLTHFPFAELSLFWIFDQVLHALGYLLLGGLLWLALRAYGHGRLARMCIVFTAAGLCAGFDELTQALLGRSGEWGDWNADLLGATLAIVAGELGARASARKAAAKRALPNAESSV